jgi:putative endonuclease
MNWFIYVLRCGNGDLYTGVTTDVARRLREHRAGQGGRFTRSRLPVELVYQERSSGEGAAKRREAELKSWPRAKKLAFIHSHWRMV